MQEIERGNVQDRGEAGNSGKIQLKKSEIRIKLE